MFSIVRSGVKEGGQKTGSNYSYICEKCHRPLTDQAVFEFENKRLLDESLAAHLGTGGNSSEEELGDKDFTSSILNSKSFFQNTMYTL
jgi:hypothetical protein